MRSSFDEILNSDIGLMSEHFVCYPLYHGKIKSYFGNFNRFISGIGRWKVLTSISCRFSLDISMKIMSEKLKLFLMVYNKSRNTLFGPLYRLKN